MYPKFKQEEVAELVWEIATFYPAQGAWSEEDYLALDTNRLVEFEDGRLEILLVPTDKHQAIVAYLYTVFVNAIHALGGVVRFAPLRLRIRPGKFREPDLMLLLKADDTRWGDAYWVGADLVIEVLSPDSHDRDLVAKRVEYARTGIIEYWIVDPRSESISQFRLAKESYQEEGLFQRGQTIMPILIPGLQISVDAVFEAF